MAAEKRSTRGPKSSCTLSPIPLQDYLATNLTCLVQNETWNSLMNTCRITPGDCSREPNSVEICGQGPSWNWIYNWPRRSQDALELDMKVSPTLLLAILNFLERDRIPMQLKVTLQLGGTQDQQPTCLRWNNFKEAYHLLNGDSFLYLPEIRLSYWLTNPNVLLQHKRNRAKPSFKKTTQIWTQ